MSVLLSLLTPLEISSTHYVRTPPSRTARCTAAIAIARRLTVLPGAVAYPGVALLRGNAADRVAMHIAVNALRVLGLCLILPVVLPLGCFVGAIASRIGIWRRMHLAFASLSVLRRATSDWCAALITERAAS